MPALDLRSYILFTVGENRELTRPEEKLFAYIKAERKRRMAHGARHKAWGARRKGDAGGIGFHRKPEWAKKAGSAHNRHTFWLKPNSLPTFRRYRRILPTALPP
jgi:hypothetical protein